MTQNAGDRRFGHGDQITVKNDTGGALDAGVPVAIDGSDGTHPTIATTGTADEADAVLADPVADGDTGEAVMHGLVLAKTSGTPSAGGSVGEDSSTFAASKSAYTVLEDAYTDPEYGYEVALIRFEGK
jgi:hypothetical protein